MVGQGFLEGWLVASVQSRVRPFRLNFFSLISKIKRIWIRFTCVLLFHYNISLLFLRFFSLIFISNFSVHFTLVIFASKRNKAKRNSSPFFRFFRFFHFLTLFFGFFRLIFVSLRFFRLIFAYFTFVFASDFWCFASKWIMWNQAFFFASKRNEIFASISNFASKAKVRAHPSPEGKSWDRRADSYEGSVVLCV